MTAEDVSEAAKKEKKDLKEILRTDVPKVQTQTPMQEIFELIHDAPVPVAVVEDGKLKGIIVRGAVIAALAGSEVNLNGIDS